MDELILLLLDGVHDSEDDEWRLELESGLSLYLGVLLLNCELAVVDVLSLHDPTLFLLAKHGWGENIDDAARDEFDPARADVDEADE